MKRIAVGVPRPPPPAPGKTNWVTIKPAAITAAVRTAVRSLGFDGSRRLNMRPLGRRLVRRWLADRVGEIDLAGSVVFDDVLIDRHAAHLGGNSHVVRVA